MNDRIRDTYWQSNANGQIYTHSDTHNAYNIKIQTIHSKLKHKKKENQCMLVLKISNLNSKHVSPNSCAVFKSFD